MSDRANHWNAMNPTAPIAPPSRDLRVRGARWLAREVAESLASPITNRVADGVDYAAHVQGVASSTMRGSRGLERAVVAGEWYHGASDRANALAQLGLDYEALERDVTTNGTPADHVWIATDVAPVLAEWRNFVQRIARSSVAAFATEWSVFVTWQNRLLSLRSSARARGIKLESADPIALPKTVWQRGADGTGTSLDTWMTLGKTVVFGVMTVAGFIGFWSILRDLRSKKPTEHELELELEHAQHEHESED